MQNNISNILSLVFGLAIICLIQSLMLMVCWNIAITSIAPELSYTIDLVESFFLVLAYKSLTYSHTVAQIRSSTFFLEQIKALEIEQRNIETVKIFEALKKQAANSELVSKTKD